MITGTPGSPLKAGECITVRMTSTLISKSLVGKMLPKRDPNSRKGQNGRILVIGGSKEYFGSPALVGLASLRSGADLCYLLVPRFIAPVVAGYLPDLIVWSYEGYYLNNKARDLLHELEKRADVLVVGNGLTKRPQVLSLARKIIALWQKALVIDADALMPGLQPASKTVVFTPHAVEFERLGGGKPSHNLNERERQVARLAGSLGATVLLKGVVDIISDGSTTLTNKTGNAGMTAGGTGDTLAGVCATLLAQGAKPLEAAAAAAFVNGAAGDRAFSRLGYYMLASDLINELPFVLKELRK